MKKKRVRRPRDYGWSHWFSPAVYIETEIKTTYVMVGRGGRMDAKRCRRLSAWLLKAAEYLEAKEGNK